MNLIAESTTGWTEWALVDGDHLLQRATTEGIDPYVQTRREISHSIRDKTGGLPESFFRKKKENVYFYCVGCYIEPNCKVVESSLTAQFRTRVTVGEYMLGAGRSLFKFDDGIVCVMGLNCGVAQYTGEQITCAYRSNGYILGDDGSSAAMGRLFLSDLLHGVVPIALAEQFYDRYQLSDPEIRDRVYKNPKAARFLAGFISFIELNIGEDYVNQLVRDSIRNYFRRNVCRMDFRKYPLRFVGSEAFRFQTVLLEVAAEFDAHIDLVKKTAIAGLIEYYAQKDEADRRHR